MNSAFKVEKMLNSLVTREKWIQDTLFRDPNLRRHDPVLVECGKWALLMPWRTCLKTRWRSTSILYWPGDAVSGSQPHLENLEVSRSQENLYPTVNSAARELRPRLAGGLEPQLPRRGDHVSPQAVETASTLHRPHKHQTACPHPSPPSGLNQESPQYSCLENARDRGAWQATVHRAAKSQTQLKWLSTHALNSPNTSCFLLLIAYF